LLSKPNILVCSDFSIFSNSALLEAEKLRVRTEGHLHVLHVSEYPVSWDWLEEDELQLQKPAESFSEQRLAVLQRTLQEQMDNCAVTGKAEVATGVPASMILQKILEHDIDLVIIGHRSKEGLLTIAGLAEKIVATAPIPVLVIKEAKVTNKIAALVNPNGPMQEIFAWANEMSYLYSAPIMAVSLFPDIEAKFFSVGKFGAFKGISPFSQEQKRSIVEEIQNRIKSELHTKSKVHLKVEVSSERKVAYHLNSILSEEKTDLAIMKRHQTDLLEKILIGSETRRMLEIFSGNLLILPP
jgi:nucleotide-binding universal stress UspA family protein